MTSRSLRFDSSRCVQPMAPPSPIAYSDALGVGDVDAQHRAVVVAHALGAGEVEPRRRQLARQPPQRRRSVVGHDVRSGPTRRRSCAVRARPRAAAARCRRAPPRPAGRPPRAAAGARARARRSRSPRSRDRPSRARAETSPKIRKCGVKPGLSPNGCRRSTRATAHNRTVPAPRRRRRGLQRQRAPSDRPAPRCCARSRARCSGRCAPSTAFVPSGATGASSTASNPSPPRTRARRACAARERRTLSRATVASRSNWASSPRGITPPGLGSHRLQQHRAQVSRRQSPASATSQRHPVSRSIRVSRSDMARVWQRSDDAAGPRALDLGQLDRRRRRALPPLLPEGAGAR